MKKIKRIFASILILVLMVTAIPEICISSFATSTETEQMSESETTDSKETDVATVEVDEETDSTEEQVQEAVTYATATTSEIIADAEITRAEWLHNLVVVFDMTVESEALPDNYFADLDETHEYYEDIILAVEFGVVDVEAGAELCPDDGATRDFAVSTLNFCLGYQLEEDTTYTYTDSDSCIDPVSAQIAINRGWVEMIDGCFSPETYLTSVEAEVMIADAETILAEQVIDVNHENAYEFTEDVIVIADGTVVAEVEDGVISITDCPETISVGDKFAVHFNGIPNVYTATSVTTEENVTIIGTEEVETDSAFETIDVEGTIAADAMEIVPAEGVEVSFEEDTSSPSTFAVKGLRDIKAEMPLKYNGVTGKLSVKIKNPYIEYSADSNKAFVTLNGVTEVTYSISGNLLEMGGLNSGFTLFTCNIGGIGSFDVSVNVNFSGSASGTVKGYLVAGVEVEKGVGIRAIRSFTQKEYYSNVDASASVSLKAFLGVTKMPVLKAYIYAEAGMMARFQKTSYSDEKSPKECSHYAAYLFASFGASVSAKFGFWQVSDSISHTIYNESNSPVRIVNHYEDGDLVAKCTRGNTYANYFTKASSRWSGCGWTGANGAYALNADGTPFVLYNYTLNENNQATITKYNGNAWSVYIPKEIDGYKVVGIGQSAFAQKDCKYVMIPDTVTSIGNYAFRYCYYLYSVTIPDSVTNIGSYAFEDCISLVDVNIPTSMETINTGVFYGCSSLRSIEIPTNIITVGSSAFRECTSLINVSLPNTIQELQRQAFAYTAIQSIHIPKSLVACGANGGFNYEYNGRDCWIYGGPFYRCESLKVVTFEAGIANIPQNLFAGCTGIENITIPNTVATIEYRAFIGCVRLQSVVLSECLTTMGDAAFRECVSLSKIIIPDTVTAISDRAFHDCISLKDITLSKSLTTMGCAVFAYTPVEKIEIPKSLDASSYSDYYSYIMDDITYSIADGPFFCCENLKEITFESGVKEISSNLFAGCVGLEKITIPNTVTTIEYNAFRDCLRLKEVNIGDSVTIIDSSAFANCVSLSEISIPNSVTKINAYAFDLCQNLAKVKLSKALTYLGKGAFSRTAITEIEIPKSLDTCDAEYGGLGSGYSYDMNDIRYAIGWGPFFQCEDLKKVTFEEGCTQVAKDLFTGCTGLETIVIPKTITKIEDSAFTECLRLTSVEFEGETMIIDDYAFYECVSLANIKIPDNTTMLGDSSFGECHMLTTFEIPDNVTTMDWGVLGGCVALESVILPKQYSIIPASMFYGCKSLKTIEIPESVEMIERYAFEGCTSLESFKLKGKTALKEIQHHAFSGCSLLKEAVLPETVTTIGHHAFQNCTTLEKAYIPQSTKALGSCVFQGCEMLSDVTIADYSITTIDIQTFKDCPALQKIVLPKGLTTIGSQAFMNDTSLTEVVIPESVTSIDSTAFSYPDKTTIYGKSGSYAETFAIENGFKFIDNSVPSEGISLLDGVEYIVMDRGETYRAVFEFYPEDSTDVITLTANNTKVTINGHDIKANSVGDTVITATASSGVTYEFTIHIRNASKIAITTQPSKVSYIMGEELDLTGMVVQVTYNDGTTREVTDYTVSGFDSSVEGKNTVTVKWVSPYGTSYTTTFDVEIIDPRPKLTGIVVDTMPAKREYERKETLDLTGLVIKATYTDGSSVEVTDYTVSGYNALKNGIQKITVTYKEFSTTFTVAVGQPLVTMGDVNGDMVIDAGDAIVISMYDAGLIELTADQMSAADVNGDGVVDAGDAIVISMYDAGLITEI